jgi:membrane protease YdiL (CAAX protease family)
VKDGVDQLVKPDPHYHVPWKPVDALVVFLLAWLGVPLALYLGLLYLQSIPIVAQYSQALEAENLLASFTFDLASAFAGLAVVGWYLQRYKVGIHALGIRWFNVGKALVYVLGGIIGFIILIVGVLTLISVLLPGFNPDEAQVNEFTKAASDPGTRRLSFIALVLIPPIIEEVVFRGFVFPAFARRWGVWAGAITSSILFGLAHLQGNVGVYTVVLGLLLCLMYVKLRSIVPGILLHMLNNYLAFLAITGK